jgi:hypothetical protein
MAYCKHCGNPLILSNGECIYCHKKPSDPVGEGGEKKPNYGSANNRQGKSREYKVNGSIKKWVIGASILILLILLYMVLNSVFSKGKSLPEQTTVERTVDTTSYPQDITGNFFVRMMNGSENANATIKIYNEGSEYAMNVYSSKITKKYTFSYNPSNGEIYSQELGRGEVRIKELTNEIEITFEGWKLVK